MLSITVALYCPVLLGAPMRNCDVALLPTSLQCKSRSDVLAWYYARPHLSPFTLILTRTPNPQPPPPIPPPNQVSTSVVGVDMTGTCSFVVLEDDAPPLV